MANYPIGIVIGFSGSIEKLIFSLHFLHLSETGSIGFFLHFLHLFLYIFCIFFLFPESELGELSGQNG